ncbi:unnamed protein product [Wickerhamomyces anomalus]
MVEVSLTVGKLDASLALLLTKDHHLIEFPTILLPDGVSAGSVVTIKCDQDLDEEAKDKNIFEDVQEQILEMFGKNEPKAPILKIKNVTQTSAVLEWEQLDLGSANIKSLTLYKNNSRLGQIPNPLVNTTTKLSGLPVDTPYEFHLRLDTTAGIYQSEPVKLRTHKMTDLSGITVCLGEIDPKEGITREDIESSLANMGAKPLQDEVKVDTTHFICTLGLGPQYKKALDNNIPKSVPKTETVASETNTPEASNETSVPKEVEPPKELDPQPEETPKDDLEDVPIDSTENEETEVKPDSTEATETEQVSKESADVEPKEQETEVKPEATETAETEQVTSEVESKGAVSTEPIAEEKVEVSNPNELESKQEGLSEQITEPVESVTATEEPVVQESKEESIEDPITTEEPSEEPIATQEPMDETKNDEPLEINPTSKPQESVLAEETKPIEETNGDEEPVEGDDGEDEDEEVETNGDVETKEQQSTGGDGSSKKKNKKEEQKKE